VVLLSSGAVVNADAGDNPIARQHRTIELAIERSGMDWTFIRPGMFATNTRLWWTESIRAQNVVRLPYPDAQTAPVHENDIAALAVTALTQPGHGHQTYTVYGPQSLTLQRQARHIGDVIGREIRVEVTSPEQARAELGKTTPPIGARIDPAPVAAPAVWTGSVGRKSLAATGRVADGWIPGHAADWLSARYRESRPVIDEAAAAAGLDPGEIRTVFNFPGRITDQPLTATRDAEGRRIGGSAGQWAQELTGAVLEHGASGFMLFSPEGGGPDAVSLGRWAREIVPAVREAIGKEAG
jgi:hypothetical protein